MKPASQYTGHLATLLASFVVFLGSTFYLYEYFLRVMPTVIIPELTQEFKFSSGGMGNFLASFFYAYAFMQVPAGLICDQLGPKRCLVGSISICALATLVFYATHQPSIAFTCRLMIGAASAFAFVAPLKLASTWFPEDRQALITGLVQLMGCLGAVFAGPPIARLSMWIGWRTCLFYTGLTGLFLAMSYALLLSDKPSNKQPSKHTQSSGILAHLACLVSQFRCAINFKNLSQVCQETAQRFLAVVLLKKSWLIGAVAFSVWAPIAIFAESWGIPYIAALQNIDTEQASQIVMWTWVGQAIASPCAGWISNYIRRRKLPCLCLLGIGLLTSCVLILMPPKANWLLACLFFSLGIASSAQPITFGMVFDSHEDKNLATAIALNNMLLISSCSFLQPLVGYGLQWLTKSGQTVSLADYQSAFVIVPLTIALGIFICMFMIKESRCIRQLYVKKTDTKTSIVDKDIATVTVH